MLDTYTGRCAGYWKISRRTGLQFGTHNTNTEEVESRANGSCLARNVYILDDGSLGSLRSWKESQVKDLEYIVIIFPHFKHTLTLCSMSVML